MTDKSNNNLFIVHSCVYFKVSSARGTSAAQEDSYLFFPGREIKVGVEQLPHLS